MMTCYFLVRGFGHPVFLKPHFGHPVMKILAKTLSWTIRVQTYREITHFDRNLTDQCTTSDKYLSPWYVQPGSSPGFQKCLSKIAIP